MTRDAAQQRTITSLKLIATISFVLFVIRAEAEITFSLLKQLGSEAGCSSRSVYACGVAMLHYKGEEDKQDYIEAARWFAIAARRGEPSAQFYLGLMFSEGQGVPQDRHQAIRYLEKSANRGNRKAIRLLSEIHLREKLDNGWDGSFIIEPDEEF